MIIIINSSGGGMKSTVTRLDDHIKGSGLRISSRRNVLLSIMEREKRHFTVDELYDITKKTNAGIGIATIYRTVRLFCEAGIVREIHLADNVTRYEVINDNSHHDHLICVKCGTFIEISSRIIENEQLKIARNNGFELKDHSLVLYGVCKKCSGKSTK